MKKNGFKRLIATVLIMILIFSHLPIARADEPLRGIDSLPAAEEEDQVSEEPEAYAEKSDPEYPAGIDGEVDPGFLIGPDNTSANEYEPETEAAGQEEAGLPGDDDGEGNNAAEENIIIAEHIPGDPESESDVEPDNEPDEVLDEASGDELPQEAVFEAAEDGELITGTCGDAAEWTLDPASGVLTITGEGDISSYSASPWKSYAGQINSIIVSDGITGIGANAFAALTSVTTAVLSDSIEKIGYRAFYNCTSLSSVNIPTGWSSCPSNNSSGTLNTNYCGHIFEGCKALTEITVPEGITVLPQFAFNKCNYLKQINLPDSLQDIMGHAFYDCSALTGIVLPESMTAIPKSLFNGCSSLQEIIIPENVTIIESYAFYNSSSLQNVTISGKVTALWEYAFSGCKALTAMVLPDSIEIIGYQAFYNCAALSSINIPESWNSCPSKASNGTMNADNCGHIFEGCKALTTVTVPDALTALPPYAFCKCNYLETINLPDAMGELPNQAFYQCAALKSMVLPKSTEIINKSLFYGCTSLTEVVIPDGVTEIAGYAFDNCSSLSAVVLPDSIERIGYQAFYRCTSLSSINIPLAWNECTSNSTSGTMNTTYCGHIFEGCSSLTEITIPEGMKSLPSFAFCKCDYIKTVNLPGSMGELPNYAFYQCTALERIVLPETTKTINKSLFYGCTSLREAVIPEGVTAIGEYAFYSCSSLNGIILPDSIERIGYQAFYKCTSLSSINIPLAWNECTSNSTSGTMSVNYCGHIFEGCSSLTEITVPEGKTSLPAFAFCKCDYLKTVNLPGSMGELPNHVFYQCTALESIVLPETTKTINKSLFYGCTSLTEVVIPDGVTKIDEYAFYGCSALEEIVLPSSLEELKSYSFNNCKSLKTLVINSTEELIIASNCFQNTTTEVLKMGSSATMLPVSMIRDISVKEYAVESGNTVFSAVNGVLYTDNNKTLVAYPRDREDTVFIMDDEITAIGQYAFYSNPVLTRIVISKNIQSIGNFAFNGCSALVNLVFKSAEYGGGSGNVSIGAYAFCNCPKLVEVKLPEETREIQEYAFKDCESLESVEFLGDAPEISSNAFNNDQVIISIAEKTAAWLEIIKNTVSGAIGFAYEGRNYDRAIVLVLDRSGSMKGEAISALKLVAEKFVSTVTGSATKTAVYVITYASSPALYGAYDDPSAYGEVINGMNANGGTNLNSAVISANRVLKKVKATEKDMVIMTDGLPESGSTSSSGPYTSADIRTYYPYANAVYNSVKSFDSAFKIYSVGYYHNSTEEEAAFGAKFLRDLQNSGYYTAADYEELLAAFGAIAEDETVYSLDLGDGKSVNAAFYDGMFKDSSYVYNHSVARLASALSLVSYKSKKTIQDGYKKLGFEISDKTMMKKSKKEATGDEANYAFGKKQITVDGEEYTLVAVSIVGSTGEEWITNFKPGSGDTHQYFLKGKEFVEEKLNDYMIDNDLTDTDHVKVLITGHSRGAAVANLLAADMDDGFYRVKPENIYTYTYATPKNTRKSNASGSVYKNIFNIVNPEDFVTKCMPAAWGFKRYGNTLTLPSSTNTNGSLYKSYLKRMQAEFANYTQDGYDPYREGELEVYKVYKQVVTHASDQDEYNNKKYPEYSAIDVVNPVGAIVKMVERKTFKTFFSGGLAPLIIHDVISESELTEAALTILTSAGCKVYSPIISFFLTQEILGRIPGTGGWSQNEVKANFLNAIYLAYEQAKSSLNDNFNDSHRMETYSAYMMTLDEVTVRSNKRSYMNSVNCPVDVEVYDANGVLVGRIVDNAVDESVPNRIAMAVDGDSKMFMVPEGYDYSIRLIGNDEGTLNYTVAKLDCDTIELERRNYLDVNVADGQVWQADYTENTDSVEDIILEDVTNNTTVPVSENISADEQGTLAVNVTVEGVGIAEGMDNLTSGDYVTLEAYTDENNSFTGWYENGEKVSDDPVYAFVITESRNLTAKFSSEIVGVTGITLDETTASLTVDEYILLNPEIAPANATNQGITFTSSDPSVATVSEYGTVVAVGAGSCVITAKTEEGEFTATCKVLVKAKEVIPATGIKLNKTSMELAAGKSETLIAEIMPENTTNQKVTWKSSNTTLATVDENGKVTGKRMGRVTITATTENGKSATCAVRILFSDVTNKNNAAYDAIYWGADKGYVNGYGSYFDISGKCTRAQFVLFLWRAAGKPQAKATTLKFKDATDIEKLAPDYKKAILWGSEKGVVAGFTSGANAGKFLPNDPCTRGQVVTFLWRYAGQPTAKAGAKTFPDVPKTHKYYKSIMWASSSGITTGFSDGKFKPDQDCTRGQCVTFLYRMLK